MWGLTLAVSPILGEIKVDLQLTYAEAGLLFSFPIIMLAALAIPGGMLADKLGIRKAAGLGALIMGVGAFLRGASTDFLTLLAFTGIYGVGWGMGVTNLPKLVSGWFPAEFSGTATGIYSTGINTGATLTLAMTLPVVYPLVGSWRGTLYFWGVLALIAAALWWILVRDPPTSDPTRHENLAHVVGVGRLWAKVWRDRNIWVVAVMLFLHNIAFYTLMGWFPTFLVLKGATAAIGAVITSIIMLVAIPTSMLFPTASDRLRLRKPFYWAAALIYAAIFYLTLFLPWGTAWVTAFILGVTMTSAWILCLILPLDLATERHVGVATGVVISIGYVGGLVGPWVAGYVMDLSGSFDSALYFLIIVTLISVAVCILGLPETGERRKNRASPVGSNLLGGVKF